jgi:hypothetical protein
LKIVTTAALTAIVFAACNGSANDEQAGTLKPGTVVAHDEYAIKEDTLNNAMHTIKVVADSAVDKGIYGIDVSYGKNFAHGGFTMPKGGERLRPLIRRGTGHTYIVGFRMKDDTTFYDYVEVTSNRENTRIQYINSYSFQ